MKKRWNLTGFLGTFFNKVGRGITSLFVCLVVLLPLIIVGKQLWAATVHIDSRKLASVQELQVRPADRNAGPVRPFEQPLITVTFDDGWESVYSTALPLFQQYGIPTTQYVLSGVFEDENYLSIAQIKDLQKHGHEIACHTVNHADLTKLTAEQLKLELEDCKKAMEAELGTKVTDFASPYGSSNASTIAAIKEVYRSHRNTNGDIVTDGVNDQDINLRANFDRYNIQAITIRRDTTVQELQRAIDYTIKNNGWLVLNYHDVEEGDSKFGLNRETLGAQLRAISSANARVATMGQVLDALEQKLGQKPAPTAVVSRREQL